MPVSFLHQFLPVGDQFYGDLASFFQGVQVGGIGGEGGAGQTGVTAVTGLGRWQQTQTVGQDAVGAAFQLGIW